MFNGEEGPVIQKAMELLVKVGNAYGAEKMIDISHVHILCWEYDDDLFDLSASLCKDVMVKVPTTTNPPALQLNRLDELRIPKEILKDMPRQQLRLQEMFKRIGAIPTYTCYPQFLLELRCGEHICLTESNVAMTANSWYGARTNMDGQTTAIASAITGKTPEYGLHLAENRLGRILIQIGQDLKAEEFDYADFSALGYFAGKVSGDRIPVYQGLSKKTTPGLAKMIWNFAWGSAAMYHIVGVTPEAWTVEAAFQGRRPEETFVYGKKEREEIFEELCTASDPRIDLVTIGCPHCTLQEIMDVTRLLGKRKVHRDVRLWVGTSAVTRLLTERMGLVDIIERAGGLVTADMCPAGVTLQPRVRATNSGTQAGLTVCRGTQPNWFGTTKDCIEAAVRGRWEAN